MVFNDTGGPGTHSFTYTAGNERKGTPEGRLTGLKRDPPVVTRDQPRKELSMVLCSKRIQPIAANDLYYQKQEYKYIPSNHKIFERFSPLHKKPGWSRIRQTSLAGVVQSVQSSPPLPPFWKFSFFWFD